MNILFAILEFGLNGAVMASLDALRLLIGRGHSVTVWSPQASIDKAPYALAHFLDLGVPVTPHANADAFDLFIADPVMAPQLVLACRGKCPILGWVHACRTGVAIARETPQAGLALAAVDRLIFPTQAAAQGYYSFLHGFPADSITILPYAVRPAAECEPALKRPGKIRIVCVGTIYPRKRQEDLIAAVAAVNDDRIECFLIGDIAYVAPEHRKIIEAAPDRFVMRGGLSPDDLQRLYRSTDIFCLPSADESFGIAIYEAAQHAIPVVLSDLDCHEGVWRHGRNCLMHPVGDARLLGALLRVLIDAPDLRQSLGEAGARIARTFSHKRFDALFELAVEDTVVGFRGAGFRGAGFRGA